MVTHVRPLEGPLVPPLEGPAVGRMWDGLRWDLSALVRGGLGAWATLAIGVLVTAASDEGGLGWVARVARTLPLAPLCAAVGVWLVLAPARARGEVLALETLGRRPSQVARSAVAGASTVAIVAALLVSLSPTMDVAAFFPVATHKTSWRWAHGTFEDPVQGLRLTSTNGLVAMPIAESLASPSAAPAHGRVVAGIETGAAGIALALLAARMVLAYRVPDAEPHGGIARRHALDVASLALCTLATIVLLQASAAGRTSALAGLVPPLGLLAFAAGRYVSLP